MGVRVADPVRPGDRLRVELHNNDGATSHHIEAEVAWSAGERAGLRWLHLTPEQERWIRYRLAPTPIRWEVVALLALCTLDLLTTLWWLYTGAATEANPLLRPFAEAGLGPFVLAKLATFVPALAAAEWYSRLRPELVVPLLRHGFTAYVCVYGLLVLPQIF